MLNVINGN